MAPDQEASAKARTAAAPTTRAQYNITIRSGGGVAVSTTTSGLADGGGVVEREVFNDGRARINVEALILAAAVERDALTVGGRAVDSDVGRDLRKRAA